MIMQVVNWPPLPPAPLPVEKLSLVNICADAAAVSQLAKAKANNDFKEVRVGFIIF
jgi:hypothetical protein